MATQLVAVTEDGKYVVNTKASSMFDQYDAIKVVSIVGPHRSGKSFLLSQLFPALKKKSQSNSTAANSHTFQVGSSINACTKGIWFYQIDTEDELKLSPNLHFGKKNKSCIK